MNKKQNKENIVNKKTNVVVGETEHDVLARKLNDANERIAIMNKDIKELCEENKKLRKSIGSYKASNTRLKSQIEEIKRESKKEISCLCDKNDDIGLDLRMIVDQNQKLKFSNDEQYEKILSQSKTNKQLENDVSTLNARIEQYNSKPWYRKMFVGKI